MVVVGCCTPNRRRSHRAVVLREEGSGRWFLGPFECACQVTDGVRTKSRARVSSSKVSLCWCDVVNECEKKKKGCLGSPRQDGRQEEEVVDGEQELLGPRREGKGSEPKEAGSNSNSVLG